MKIDVSKSSKEKISPATGLLLLIEAYNHILFDESVILSIRLQVLRSLRICRFQLLDENLQRTERG
jgi:hypothetical protein